MTERDKSALAKLLRSNIWALAKREGDLIIYGGAQLERKTVGKQKEPEEMRYVALLNYVEVYM